jgi:NhaP-type Na+/H+ or K+/H+ antiporter
MNGAPWFVAAGIILIVIALTSSLLRRMPLSTPIICLMIGIILGPAGVGLLKLDFVRDATLIERLTEVAVIVSLFTAGLQLRLPLNHVEWRIALRLATLAMALTVALIATMGVFTLGLSVGVSIILGAILAPTDPVLASDVQVKKSTDSDRLRFVLTGEAGFNDGTAFPFVMLGLGILGLHDIGSSGWRWWTIDVLWAVSAGLVSGAALGTTIGKVVLYLRQHHREAVGLDNFLAVGLIALSYGIALYGAAYGFLAVFAAGVALRRVERTAPSPPPSDFIRASAGAIEVNQLATAQETAPAYMAEAVLNFNVHLERFAEVVLVIVVGAMLSFEPLTPRLVCLVIVLLFVFRPLAVYVSLMGIRLSRLERGLIAWFGIRGIGSIYYLSFAIEHGLLASHTEDLVNITLATVATSILVHGICATPLMDYYGRKSGIRHDG